MAGELIRFPAFVIPSCAHDPAVDPIRPRNLYTELELHRFRVSYVLPVLPSVKDSLCDENEPSSPALTAKHIRLKDTEDARVWQKQYIQ